MGQTTERLFDQAKANLREENHEHALRLFNEVLNREPTHLQALRSKALIKITTDEAEEAEEFMLFAIEQQPEDDQLHQMLGTFYLNNEMPNKALHPLKRAVELNPTNDIAHHGLGLLYSRFQGDHSKAVIHFTKVIAISEDSANAFFNRGCSYMILQDMQSAKTDFRKAEALDHPKAKEMLAEYF